MLGQLYAALASTAIQATPPAAEIPSEPAINTGTGLLENCTYSDDSNPAESEFHLGQCIGFIKGVTNAWSEQGPDQICPPDELDNERLRDVVVTWLRSHPEALERQAVGSVISATTETFPCTPDSTYEEKPGGGPISVS
jgi:hypothetical protein